MHDNLATVNGNRMNLGLVDNSVLPLYRLLSESIQDYAPAHTIFSTKQHPFFVVSTFPLLQL